jgi:cytochrome bd ubiquinol oxidase subunit I
MRTANASSPSVTSTDIWISLIVFVLIYAALGAADLVLMLRYARKGLGHEAEGARSQKAATGGAGAVSALTY